jgi:hypothetical protein
MPSANTVPGEELARQLFGPYFFTPQQVRQVLPDVSYTAEQLETFAKGMPDKDKMTSGSDNGLCLMPGPNTPLSIRAMREFPHKSVYQKPDPWLDRQTFASSALVKPGWIMVRMSVVPQSAGRTFLNQKCVLPPGESIPNAAQVYWCLLLYHAIRRVFLLRDTLVRTDTLDDGKQHVLVGKCDGKGVRVCDGWDEHRSSTVGLLTARIFELK